VLKKLEFKRRQIPLFVLLAFVLAVWIFTLIDGYMMRQALAAASVEHIQATVGTFGTEPGSEMVKEFDANREFILFGNTTGSVTVFFKAPGETGEIEYSGIVIGFEQREAEWVMVESRGFEIDELPRAAAAFGGSV
jgi:hypothetical protein